MSTVFQIKNTRTKEKPVMGLKAVKRRKEIMRNSFGYHWSHGSENRKDLLILSEKGIS